MAKAKKQFEVYDGVVRVLTGQAIVFRDPVQKNDKFDHDGEGVITTIYRDGEPLYELGQVVGNGYALIVHLEVDPNPGNMTLDEAAKEGFMHLRQFREAFVEAHGEDALWRPAWRIRCERQTEYQEEIDDAELAENMSEDLDDPDDENGSDDRLAGIS